MIRQVPFTVELWQDIRLQSQQTREHDDALVPFSDPDLCWAYVDDEGHCLAAGSLYEAWPGVGVALAYIGDDAGPVMPALFKRAQSVIRANRYRWPILGSAALDDFDAGKRLLCLLGFVSTGETLKVGARVYALFNYPREH